MHKKNLKSQESNSTKHTGDRPPEMVELSDEALSQVWGGHSRNLCAAQWLREHTHLSG